MLASRICASALESLSLGLLLLEDSASSLFLFFDLSVEAFALVFLMVGRFPDFAGI